MLDCYNNFVEFNTTLGYLNKPTSITCKIKNPENESDFITYDINHNLDGSRFTGSVCSQIAKNKLHFYGCSITWGHGVSDTSTFPYKVQSLLGDEICVKNYGVGSYSTLQAYLLFEQHLIRGDTPQVAVLDYGSFQNSRNIMGLSWRNAWFTMAYTSSNDSMDLKFPNFAVPYAILEDNKLKINYYSKSDMFIPYARRLFAIWDNIYVTRENIRESKVDSEKVAIEIIKNMKERCDSLGIKFILCGIFDDIETVSMLNYFSNIDYNCVNISVNHKDSKYNLLPYDPHLNDLANSILANHFVNYFKSEIRL